MPLLILSPVALLLAVALLAPQAAFLGAAPLPLAAWLTVALTALLAAVMRQWSWGYWLALLAGAYFAVDPLAGASSFGSASSGALFFLPLLGTVFALLLALLPTPPLPSMKGVLLLSVSAAALPLLSGLAWNDYHIAMDLPEVLLNVPFNGIGLSVLVLGALGVLGGVWLSLLAFAYGSPARWGQFCCWLSLMLVLAFMWDPRLSGWAVIAGALAILLALAGQMLRLAYYDELTLLPHRRALMAHLKRLGRRSAVTMVDVDHFKKFNDTYGHDVGDQVLRLLGSIFAREPGCKAYRYGGEEFTLVFDHNDPDVIGECLERVRAQVADYPFKYRSPQRARNNRKGKSKRGAASKGKILRITISLGGALRRDEESAAQLLKRADTILYKAKQAGRNRAIVKG